MFHIINFLKKRIPSFKGFIFKIIYSSKKIKFGKQFKCVSFPSISITDKAEIVIGDNVYFGDCVEIRSHKNSKIIIGNSVKIDRGVRILGTNDATIKISSNVKIGLHSVINGGDSVSIGHKSLISGFVYVQTSMHKYDEKKFIQDQGYNHSRIKIGDDVWIGAHATILPGCHIDNGSIVGSNAVVTKSFGKNVIVAGVPSELIKKRFD